MDLWIFVKFATHVFWAVVLFFSVNWIGKHAVEFGYSSSTLFDETNESAALNFFLRAMAPAVFIIVLSAAAVSIGQPELRYGSLWIVVYYYLIRTGVIFLLNRQGLIKWHKFAFHAVAGVVFAALAYEHLIIPNRSLLPNVEQMGNEIWLAIAAFLYAVANKVPVTGGPGARRQNNFIRSNYEWAKERFSHIIEEGSPDRTLVLLTYAVLIYENYARPPAIRVVERAMFWKPSRTTGVMQVRSKSSLSDEESVRRGKQILAQAWAELADNEYPYYRVRNTIAKYNSDDHYVSSVYQVMAILATRTDPTFRPAYDALLD